LIRVGLNIDVVFVTTCKIDTMRLGGSLLLSIGVTKKDRADIDPVFLHNSDNTANPMFLSPKKPSPPPYNKVLCNGFSEL
jgi:hypothetical protein